MKTLSHKRHAELVSASRFRNKFGMTLLLFLFSFLFFSCENGLGPDNSYIEETVITDDETPARQKAYITFNLVESQRSAASRAVTSAITSSLFSDITFSGSSTDSSDTVTRTAASFSELAGQTIEVTAGNWTFTLEAYLGKTDTNPGEKYTASQSKTIAPGNNQLQMKLAPDSSVTANPTAHPGDWEVTITFPNSVAAPVDRVEVALYGYADFTSSTATPLYSKTFVTGTDYETSGPQTLTAGESSRATGNYIVYVRFLKNVSQQGTDFTSETLSTWSEFMRINPGARSSGTISLDGLDASYTITYNLGGAQWNPSSTESIPICYTRKTLASGAISLPGTSAGSDVFVDRGSLYQFLGWYTSPDFADGTGPVTNISSDSTGPKTFYAKWHEPVFDLYISATEGVDGSPNDGTKDKPYKTATYAYSKFDDPDATDSAGNIRNTIHILSDYTGDNKITSPWGDSSISDLQVKFVGENNKTEEAPVTLEVNVNSPAYSFIYLAGSQKMKFSYIDIISSATVGSPNGHGCLFAVSGTELYFENSSIKGYKAEGCSAIESEGKVYLKDCEISGNTAVDGDPDADKVWGCAVNVGTGEISISGQVVIKDNETVTSDSSHAHADESYNLYLGTDDSGSPVLHHVEITDAITGSEIWVKLANGPEAFTTGYSTHMGTTSPSDCFYNDNGLEVVFDSTNKEADLSKHCTVYVSSTSSSPAGNNTNGKGTLAKPYASLEKAIKKITDIGSNQIDATIYVSGDVPCNTTIIDFTDPSMGAELKAKSLTIEGRGTGSTWQEKAAQSILNGDTDGDGTGDGCILDISVNIPFTFKNLTFKNGNTSYSGGALSVGYTVAKPLNISECIFENNKADNGGAVKTSYANSTITNVEVKSNSVTGSETANGEGGGFYFAGGSHSLSSVTFDGNTASRYGGAISTDKNAITSITIEDCTLKNNQAVLQGGAIYISSGSSVTMSGTSAITDNAVTGLYDDSSVTVATNKCGGGVYVNKTASFTMNAGTISGNGAYSGGAVYTRGQFDLVNGTISNNKRVTGTNTNPNLTTILASVISSNVEVATPGTFNMLNGEITASSSMTDGQNGAAVCLYAASDHGDENGTATFNMEGGKIHGFNISENGAVYLRTQPALGSSASYQAQFNMSGGEIYSNTSTASAAKCGGGGVHLADYATFKMTGGQIYGNKAVSGGGVYLKEIFGAGAPKVILGKSGSTSKVTIKNNKEGTAEIASNLYLQVGDVIKIEGPLDEASEINLTRPFAVDTFTQDFSTYNTAFEPGTVFVSDAGYSIVKKLNEASFAANNGSVYTGLDYIFTLSINKNQVEKGMPAAITVIPSVKRKEAGDTSIDLYYNPADQMLYEDSAYTVAAGGDNTVTFEGSLWCGDYEEEDTVTAGSGDEAGKLIISALTFADDYKLNVTVTYMGVAHDATFNILCREPENISSVTSKTYNESSRLADSNIFIANRSVTMKKLAASDHEVTQQEYEKYCSYDSTNKVNATNGLGANYPVYYVSWYDAIVYCNLRTIDEMGIDSCVYTINGKKHPKDWPSILGNATDGYRGAASELSVWNNVTIDLDAAGWRLPTELEWEYLARGGNLSADGQTEWSGSSDINEVAYYEDSPETNSGSKAHEIKGKKQNALGLYDMTGNVFEWVSDWYLENMISSIDYSGPTYSEARDPYGKKEKNFRGGAYSKNAADSRLANRGWHQPPNMRFVDIGFRVVRTIK